MSRDGLLRENMTTGETENISKRIQENPENDIPKNPISDKEMPKRKSSRLTFTEEERNIPELQRYIKKSDQTADRLDKARDKIPKKKSLSFEREFDEKTGKGKTRLHFEEKEKPIVSGKSANPLSPALNKAGTFVHKKIYETEHDNAGVEAAHKTEKAAEKTKQAGSFIIRHRRGPAIIISLFIIFILIFTGLSSCSSLLSGGFNGISGTSYTSEDSDLVAVENAYASMENELQGKIDNVEKDYPGMTSINMSLMASGTTPMSLLPSLRQNIKAIPFPKCKRTYRRFSQSSIL